MKTQTIQIHTPDGVKEYPYCPDSAALTAAMDAGEIHVGDDIVYRNYLVYLHERNGMVLLDTIQMPMPDMGGMPPQFVPDMQIPNGAQWSFTVNGQPVTPEQMAQFMGGNAR